MKTVKVKFLKYHSWGNKGETRDISPSNAEQLVKDRYAVLVADEPKAESPKPARKTRTKPENKAMSAG